jgi:hypothetical protein
LLQQRARRCTRSSGVYVGSSSCIAVGRRTWADVTSYRDDALAGGVSRLAGTSEGRACPQRRHIAGAGWRNLLGLRCPGTVLAAHSHADSSSGRGRVAPHPRARGRDRATAGHGAARIPFGQECARSGDACTTADRRLSPIKERRAERKLLHRGFVYVHPP